MGLIPQQEASLLRRQDDGSDNGQPTTQIIVAAVVVGIIAAIAIVVGIVAYVRKKKSIDRHRRLASTDESELQSQQPETSTAPQRRRTSAFNTNRLSVKSIASIITLPPYKETPGETEEVIAREGEREGLDYIVEGPETAEELEERRQEEVAAIYRVQQTRRRELEERAERRRARRAALDDQDYREVARLDRAAREARLRQRNDSTTSVGQQSQSSGVSGLDAVVEGLEPSSGALLAELQEIRSRGRRASAVTYATLGVQRHDGSRLRATSIDSDNQPLLEEPANMGRTSADYRSTRSRASSTASNNPSGPNTGRERSRSRASRNGVDEDTNVISMQLSEDGIPPQPPSYDDDLSVHAGDAPRYEDVVLDTPRHSIDIATAHAQDHRGHESHPHAEVHEDEPHSLPRVVRTSSGPKPPSAIPLRLQTSNISTPSIEIVNPTPVHSRPGSPPSASGSQRSPTDRR